jgi:hypothetical protein
MATSFNGTAFTWSATGVGSYVDIPLDSLTFGGGDVGAVDFTAANSGRKLQVPGLRAPFQITVAGKAPIAASIPAAGAYIDWTITGNTSVDTARHQLVRRIRRGQRIRRRSQQRQHHNHRRKRCQLMPYEYHRNIQFQDMEDTAEMTEMEQARTLVARCFGLDPEAVRTMEVVEFKRCMEIVIDRNELGESSSEG